MDLPDAHNRPTWPILAACLVLAVTPVRASALRTLAVAQIQPLANSRVFGTVRFLDVAGEQRLDIRITGLPPGAHGFAILAARDCAMRLARQSGGHFNPTGAPHGQHVGDLPNLFADSTGQAILSGQMGHFDFSAGANSILQHSLVITEQPDNHAAQPDGNAGLRIACGVIEPGAGL